VAVLEGIRVLDLGIHIAAPYCTSLLADQGAEVIRIERPGGDNDRRIGYGGNTGDSYAFMARNRNKRGITLDITTEPGREILYELVRRSDVLVEALPTGEMKAKLGVDYACLSGVNQRIIVVSVSAFGLTGPYADRAGFDTVAQALSGAMSCTGFPGDAPLRSAVAWVDFATGLHAVVGVMFALWDRLKTGRGQLVDVALLDSAAALMMLHGIYGEYIKQGVERPQLANYAAYTYANTFRAKDGWVFISCTRDGIWRRFARIIGRDDLLEDSRFRTDWDRFVHRQEIDGIVNAWAASRSVEEITGILGDRVPCCRVNSIPEAVAEPQLASREMIIPLEYEGAGEVPVPGSPVKLSDAPCRILRPAPLVGEHNREIYVDLLDYSEDRMRELENRKVI